SPHVPSGEAGHGLDDGVGSGAAKVLVLNPWVACIPRKSGAAVLGTGGASPPNEEKAEDQAHWLHGKLSCGYRLASAKIRMTSGSVILHPRRLLRNCSVFSTGTASGLSASR